MPTGWALAATINQGLLTGAAFLAMGSALFALWVPTPPAAQALIRVVGRRASALAVVFYLAAGAYFGMLFVVRGFGIAVGAHAFYDILSALFAATAVPAHTAGDG